MSTAPEPFDDLSFTLGDRMEKALKRSGRSVAETAAYFQVSRNTISNWTNDKTTPRASDIRQWALWTAVPYEWLITGELPPAVSGMGNTPRQKVRHLSIAG